MKRFFPRASALLIALVAIPLLAEAFTSPGQPKGFINDFTGALTQSAVASLEQQASALKKATGAEIAVVIVPTLQGEDGRTYATDLFAAWGIGEKGRDNGLLMLVALEEREIHIEVGYGLEGQITDLQAKQVIDRSLAPAFRAGHYEQGIRDALLAIEGLIKTGEMPGADSLPEREGKGGNALFLLLLFVGQILIAIMAKSKSWWLGGVFGAVAGTIVGYLVGSLLVGAIAILTLVGFGLLVDYIVSKRSGRGGPPFMFFGGHGGSSGGFGGGGFGGFGGGSSGGGGASGRW